MNRRLGQMLGLPTWLPNARDTDRFAIFLPLLRLPLLRLLLLRLLLLRLLLLRLLLIGGLLANGRGANAATYDEYHVGLDFITSTVGTDNSFVCNFAPYPIDGTTNFVSQGGTGQLTEGQIHRQIVMAVEDAFRQISTGDINRTVAIAIHSGKLDTSVLGRRLNVALSQLGTALPPFDKPPFSGVCPELLGQAKQGAWGSNLPQDSYAAGVYLNNIDDLGDPGRFVIYDTLDEVTYGISGTTAHEVGHLFGAVHVQTTANVSPQPLMAHEDTGLPTAARFTPRRFDNNNANTIRANVGTVLWGDFNLDKSVDAADAEIMFANWALTDRLFHEGDANNDHLVDAADAGVAFGNWTGDAGPHNLPEPSGGGWVCMLLILNARRRSTRPA